MRIAKVIGTVTLSRSHPLLVGGCLKLAVPMTLDELKNRREPHADSMVVYDEMGANEGNLIMISEGAEAAQPFYPDVKPIDAYDSGILDDINIPD